MVGGPLLLACCRHVSCDRQAGSAAPPTPTLCTAQQEWPLTACHTHTEMEVSSVHKQQWLWWLARHVLWWLGGARQCSGGWEGPGSAVLAGRG